MLIQSSRSLLHYIFACLICLPLARAQDTTIQFQIIEIKAPRLQTFKTGVKTQTFKEFQNLSSNTQDLGEVLALHTPIFIKDYGPGRLATTAIRGASAAQTAIIWNGFNINNPMLGQTDLSLIPFFLMDKVFVQYGSNSTSWGSGAIGGTILLENEPAYGQKWEGYWQSHLGSFQDFFNGIKIGYSNDKFSTQTKIFYQDSENNFPIKNGQSERLTHAQVSKGGVLQKNAYRINDKQHLEVNIWYQDASRNLPPNLVQQRSEAFQEDQSLRSSINWKRIGKNSTIQAKSGFFYEKLYFEDPLATIFSDNKTWTSQQEIEWTHTPTTQHKILLGANHSFLKAQSTGFDNQEPTQHRPSIFGMYHWQSSNKKWNVQLALRQEWIDWKAAPLTPSLAFEGQLSTSTSVKARVSRSYRVPTFNDLFWQFSGNPSLLPESGWNKELSWLWQVSNNIKWSITGYNRNINNWIIWLPNNGIWVPQNLQRVWSRGAENNLEWTKTWNTLQLKSTLLYDLTFSTNQPTNTTTEALIGKQLIYVPKHRLNASLQLSWKSWTLALYHIYTGKVYTLADNSAFLPSYHLNHLFVYKRFESKSWKGNAFIKLKNIFGVNYQVIAQFPMPRQHFELGWQVGF